MWGLFWTNLNVEVSTLFHIHALASRLFFGWLYFLLRFRTYDGLDSHWACVLAGSSSCYCRSTIKLATSGGQFCKSKYRLKMWGLFWTNLTVEASTFFHLRAMASRFFFGRSYFLLRCRMHDGLDSHRACVVATELRKQKKKHINFLLLAVHLILSSRGFWYVHTL